MLTGMGNDGAKGFCKLKDKGAYVMAQDQATSSVWGMPRAVAENGCADEILAVRRHRPAHLRAVWPRLKLRAPGGLSASGASCATDRRLADQHPIMAHAPDRNDLAEVGRLVADLDAAIALRRFDQSPFAV